MDKFKGQMMRLSLYVVEKQKNELRSTGKVRKPSFNINHFYSKKNRLVSEAV
jgi:hypothetical protein